MKKYLFVRKWSNSIIWRGLLLSCLPKTGFTPFLRNKVTVRLFVWRMTWKDGKCRIFKFLNNVMFAILCYCFMISIYIYIYMFITRFKVYICISYISLFDNSSIFLMVKMQYKYLLAGYFVKVKTIRNILCHDIKAPITNYM